MLFDRTDHNPAEVLLAAHDAAARDDLAAAVRILGIETPPAAGPLPGNEAARAAVAAIDDDLTSTEPPHETVDETGDGEGWAR